MNTDTVPEIQHIIILMMENHSFDNYLGMLDRSDVDRFHLDANGDPTHTNHASDGTTVRLTRRTDPKQVQHVPSQSWHGSHTQWNGGANDGFIKSVEELLGGTATNQDIAMQYWTKNELPFYDALARVFPVADRWFCSCLGPTFPNRRFLIAGTTNGLIDDLPFGMFDVPKGGTIFDLLTTHGIDWRNYHPGRQIGIQARRLLGPIQRSIHRLKILFAGLSPKLIGSLVNKIQFTADLYPLKFWSVHNHVRTMNDFFKDAADGTLPAVSIVDPDFGSCSEENPQDVQIGEGFAAAVINAVLHGKGWPSSLLIWTYDEHGGYYDHVPPPKASPPDDVLARSVLDARAPLRWLIQLTGQWTKIEHANKGPRTYDDYGFRVPTVIVSPFAKRNFITHQLYDHTSILKFIEQKWNLPSLTDRDRGANSFLEALDFSGGGPFRTPPLLPPPAKPWGS